MTKQNVLVSEAQSAINMAITVAVSNSSIFTTAAQKPPPAHGGYFSISRNKLLKNLEINNNGGTRTNGWIDSMRASSPTHIKSTPSLTDEQSSWILHHPSALDMFEQIIAASKGKQIVMFLDYDGTLSPIVEDPDRAFMSDAMRKTVKKLARCFPTAIVSGRCRDKSCTMPEAMAWTLKDQQKGNQGVLFQAASEFLPMIDEKWNELALQVRSVLKEYPKLRLSSGRKVLEIRPTIKWDKGKALEFLLESLGFANCTDVFPVYIGDDKTDEDAFKILRDRGQGFGILVSKFPKDTSASYSLQEPTEVMNFLQKLVEYKRRSLRG
ncbi:hypothetical protein FEM48_Zijuj08G0164000 [Ziziphus jujuba var. spinosa]|uniref:trehalose-phosphatase n=1 Tax=Ziziphus jujuba var. spinosa TaxID=714518 RepID=A0A978V051_ZIZJJ|nr:hypothetical protein FEM48_Zijuj08G0164000 [Ziziphus jujuba var. spinosa]